MDTKEDNLSLEVDYILRIVNDLLEKEAASAAAAFMVGGSVMTCSCLTLKVSPQGFHLALEELAKDYKRLYGRTNGRQD